MPNMNRQEPNPSKSIDKPPEENEIVGLCYGEALFI